MDERRPILTITKDDFRIDTFRAGGKGGQNQNKVNSGCRFTHLESGAVGEARDSRDFVHNKKSAFNRCIETKKFQIWFKKKISEKVTGKTLEQEVDEDMKPSNLKVETCKDGLWQPFREEG